MQDVANHLLTLVQHNWETLYVDLNLIPKTLNETYLFLFISLLKCCLCCECQVFLNCGVELWLSEISRVLQETVHDTVVNCVEDAKTLNYIDEIAQKVECTIKLSCINRNI